MALTLAYKEFGAGSPIVVLHGLFGSARNWQAIAKRLAAHHHVYTLDLRNHGASPWADSMSYHDMAEDVAVITSYSIHYTKLYETVKGYGMGVAGEGQNITHQQKKMGEDARITSYNVCYTKLLRAATTLSAVT